MERYSSNSFENDENGFLVRYDDVEAELAALRARLAGAELERNAAIATIDRDTIRIDMLTRDRDAALARVAEVERERDALRIACDAAHAREDVLKVERESLRARLAEVGRERDEAREETAKAWLEVDCGGDGGCELCGPMPCRAHSIDILARARMEVAALRKEHALLASERDDARRVAKRLANKITRGAKSEPDDVSTALAYEVGP